MYKGIVENCYLYCVFKRYIYRRVQSFDKGTQRSFSEHLANEQQLNREGIEIVYLFSFGSIGSGIQHLEPTRVHLVTENKQTLPISVLIVSTIATPLCLQSQT